MAPYAESTLSLARTPCLKTYNKVDLISLGTFTLGAGVGLMTLASIPLPLSHSSLYCALGNPGLLSWTRQVAAKTGTWKVKPAYDAQLRAVENTGNLAVWMTEVLGKYTPWIFESG